MLDGHLGGRPWKSGAVVPQLNVSTANNTASKSEIPAIGPSLGKHAAKATLPLRLLLWKGGDEWERSLIQISYSTLPILSIELRQSNEIKGSQ